MRISETSNLPTGRLSFRIINRETGEVVDQFDDKNVLVVDSRTSITRAIAGNTLGVIRFLKIGNDVGSGTIYEPEPAHESYDENVMNVLFESQNLTVGYPDPRTVAFNVLVRGTDVLRQHPGLTDVKFTSAALHTADGNVFSYKRFPVRTISDVLDLSIVWTIGF